MSAGDLHPAAKYCLTKFFPLSEMQEYTVEAGRPDCTDEEKLRILKEYGATRISINPQTFSDEVLRNIGRRHTAQDILDCYRTARAVGHDNINMDLIAGLPGDTVEASAAAWKRPSPWTPKHHRTHPDPETGFQSGGGTPRRSIC